MFSFAITGKGEGVLQKSSIPFSHTKEKAGRMEKEREQVAIAFGRNSISGTYRMD